MYTVQQKVISHFHAFSCIKIIKIEGKILNPTNDSIEFKIFSVFFVQI